MASPESHMYFSFGISVAVAMYIFVEADHLWKKEFMRLCFLTAVALSVVGVVLEFFQLLGVKPGITLIVMSASLIYLFYFSLLRFFYMRAYGYEPYITSQTSTIGSPPFEPPGALKDGKRRKYPAGRRITSADFGFSLLQALAPVFTILGLIWFSRILDN